MNIERALIKWGNANLPYPTYLEVPGHRDSEFITLGRTSGSESAYGAIDRPIIAVQCWAKSLARAAEMAYEVDELILECVGDIRAVSTIERNSLYPLPSPDGIPRYQMVYDLTTIS